MKKICVIGSLNMDLVVDVRNMPKPGETIIGGKYREAFGGKGANQAVAISRLQGDVSMIGKLGMDAFGNSILDSLKKDGVNCSYIQQVDCTTGVAFITVDNNAQNSIVVSPGANYRLGRLDIDKNIEAINECDIVVVQLEVPLETVRYALLLAKLLDKFTILNPAPAVELDDEIIKNVDLLIPNESELALISGVNIDTKEDVIVASKKMIDKGIKSLIVTLGSKGSLYIDKDKEYLKEPYKVNAIDTTAAGDSYIGAIAVGLSKGYTIDKAMDFASKVGALTVTKKGAQSSLPTLEEVIHFGGQK